MPGFRNVFLNFKIYMDLPIFFLTTLKHNFSVISKNIVHDFNPLKSVETLIMHIMWSGLVYYFIRT